jgi:hypothetical protein
MLDEAMKGGAVLTLVAQLDAMDESMWTLLQRNLTGITEEEADWCPHPAANNVRWILGHLAWFEEWAHDALERDGRYLTDRLPTAILDGSVPELLKRFAAARVRYRACVATRTEATLQQKLSYFGQYDVSELALLQTHALHLAGHRFQIRYVRGAFSRAHGTSKADFDPW